MPAPPPAIFSHPKLSNTRKPRLREVEHSQSNKYVAYNPNHQLFGYRGATDPPIAGFARNVEAYNYLSKQNSKMPYRRRYRPRRNRRRRKVRGRGRRSRITSLWPRTRLVKFRVVKNFNTTSGTGTISEIPLLANSLSDPLGSLTAALPLGLDQYATMYQRYCIVASRCFVRAHCSTVTGATMFGLSLLRSNAALTDFDYHLEQPLVKSRMLTADIDHSGIGLGYSGKRFWKIRKWMDAEEQQGTFSTTPGDPTDLCYYVLWFQDVTKAQAVTLEGVVTIEYTALLFDPIIPARSTV